MGMMSVRLDDNKRKALKAIASLEGKTISGIVAELVEEYIKNKMVELGEEDQLMEIMKLSEASFNEWDNKEDEIYNNL